MENHPKYLLAILLAIPFLLQNLEARPKTDVVVLANGDRITGEIKRLERGILTFKTDWMGTLSVEWPYVKEIQSEYFFEVILTDGRKNFGSIRPAVEGDQLEIVSQNFKVGTDHLKIVSITPIEREFLDRIKFSVELGANYYSSNASKKISFGTDFGYRTEKYGANAHYGAILNEQDRAPRTKRNELKTSFQRYLANNWQVVGVTNLLQSEELNLDLRSVFGGGVARELVQTNRVIFAVTGGAALNREKYVGEPYKNSMEGFGGITFQTFKFDKPEMDITSTLYTIPSLSDWGRVRLEFDTSLRFKLFRDLYWSGSVFENYDSRPPDGNVKNDFGVETTFGWSFN